MKKILAALPVLLLVLSCRRPAEPLVNSSYIDSLLTHYSPSAQAMASDNNLVFWKKRIDSLPDNFVNGPEYASALISQFRLYGDIRDLIKADSLMKLSNEANQEKEAGIFRTLASCALLRHRFDEADSLVKKAVIIEGFSTPNLFTDFDISFETGDYQRAKAILKLLNKNNQYAWFFRRSKYEHYDGSLDSAISCMIKAAEKANNNIYLRQAALSNAADLCTHKGDLAGARDLYLQSIKTDVADFHSIAGLGWIALVYDKNDSLAERIFRFVQQHRRSPDALLKLEQVAEARRDSIMQKRYAEEFADLAADRIYGKMYSKYLIGLYTGILNQPQKAVLLAKFETGNRPTPQAFAWYAWSLYCNGRQDSAYTVFREKVSGQALEGPELYYMAKMMQGLGKKYNAQEFFKAAYKNRYDLSPVQQRDIEENL